VEIRIESVEKKEDGTHISFREASNKITTYILNDDALIQLSDSLQLIKKNISRASR